MFFKFMKLFCAKTDLSSIPSKLSLPMFLECFLIFASCQPCVSYILVSYKKRVGL